MSTFGYYRFAAATPQVRVADVEFNTAAVTACLKEAAANGAHIVLFPEMCLTGYTCGDLFHQPTLLQSALWGLQEIAAETKETDIAAIIDIPMVIQDGLFNVAAVVQGGRVHGFVPKSILPNYREFYEQRQFRSARELTADCVTFAGVRVPLGTDLIFRDANNADLTFGIEICEDLWSVMPPSSRLALQGARVIFNPSASDELAGKAPYRRALIAQQSARCLAAYVFSSAGVGESTQDVVYGGHALIADNGRIAAESERFCRDSQVIYADIDCARLGAARLSESSFNDSRAHAAVPAARVVEVPVAIHGCDLVYAALPPRPFLPSEAEAPERCEDILSIQTAGLAKRMEHTHAKTLVIGVSGGLDSTLALIICARACKLLGLPMSTIRAVTMPGFGTTGRTYANAVKMIELLGADFKAVNIKEACLLHFKDLDFDPALRTTTYENVQARERTKILMNLANKTGGMVVGTGDLSEIALGWSTYNGDHMSMYAVNCSIPKTLIRCLISHVAKQSGEELAAVLQDIIDTPVSPELLPPSDDGSIEQKTEDILGPYDLHDFFLYHFIKYGAEPEKLAYLAKHAFAGEYADELVDSTLKTFIRRFFMQQFKRSCIPDGPKVGTIALSPRGDWRMPSDAVANEWLSRLENAEV
ncbi:MAG: NAD(+) synthase [Akkermansia sp.]|nr:NAD(+) synthase [Akkermansia sp.]